MQSWKDARGKKLYLVSDIADAIGLVRSPSLADYGSDLVIKKYAMVNGRHCERKFFTEKGVKVFLSKTRKEVPAWLLSTFNMEETGLRVVPKETQWIGAIVKSFAGKRPVTQRNVGPYRIDLYFEHEKVAVECDENGHRDRSRAHEQRRQKYITDTLGCRWVRFDPDAPAFDIFDVIGEISKLM